MESHIYNKKVACFIHSSNMDIWKTDILENFINQMKNANFFDLVDFAGLLLPNEPWNLLPLAVFLSPLPMM